MVLSSCRTTMTQARWLFLLLVQYPHRTVSDPYRDWLTSVVDDVLDFQFDPLLTALPAKMLVHVEATIARHVALQDIRRLGSIICLGRVWQGRLGESV